MSDEINEAGETGENKGRDDYPMNLLNAIAYGNWEYPVPADIERIVAYVLESLTGPQREIIKLRYESKMTAMAISKELKITSSAVRQREIASLRKLRKPAQRRLLETGMQSATNATQESRYDENTIDAAQEPELDPEHGENMDGDTNAIVSALADAVTTTTNELHKALADIANLLQVMDDIWRNPENAAKMVEHMNIMKTPIKLEDAGLSIRTLNCLKRAGCDTLQDVTRFTIDNLYSIRYMNKTDVAEIINVMARYGLAPRPIPKQK